MSKRVTHDGRGAFEIRFGFDRRLVDLVKTLPDRRWNPSERFWSVPDHHVVALVDLLDDQGFSFDDATRSIYADGGGTRPLAAPPSSDSGQPGLFDSGGQPGTGRPGDLTVSALNDRVQEVIEAAFPAPVWLVGEISGFNKGAHRRHVTFHLVERDDDGKAVSEVSATLFQGTRRDIEAALAAAGEPFKLEDEVTVRVRARVELYVPWGLYRVVVEDLDLHYTLGEAARRREEIIRKLTEEGLVELNTSLSFPALPLRVGLVTSLGSDAFNDVRRTLDESGFAFRLTAHGARVQGHLTEPSVLNALDWFRDRADDFDVVLVCRGGGSRTDLAWFDSEALGRAVARFPLPVVVGIGHEQDHSVLDAVGWRRKTPTAAASFLVERVREALERVEECGRRVLDQTARRLRDETVAGVERARRLARGVRGLLERHAGELTHGRERLVRAAAARLAESGRDLARRSTAIPRAAWVRIGQERAILGRAGRQLVQGARRDLLNAARRVSEVGALLAPGSRRRLALETERLEGRDRRLALVDPVSVVERGYAILRAEGGDVVTEPAAAPDGSRLTARLRGGTLRLRSEGAAGSGNVSGGKGTS